MVTLVFGQGISLLILVILFFPGPLKKQEKESPQMSTVNYYNMVKYIFLIFLGKY